MDKNNKIKQINNDINLLRPFIRPDYPNLGIYSNTYFKHILKSLLKSENSTYSVIYGDVNGLSTINDVYGKEEGDRVLRTLLTILVNPKYLPKDAIIIRIGGDEFAIILRNTESQKAQSICNQLNIELEKQSQFLHHTNITLATKDSKDGNNIDHLLEIAERDVSTKKSRAKRENFKQEQKDNCFDLITPYGDLSYYKKKLKQARTPEKRKELEDKIQEMYQENEAWERLNQMIQTSCSNHLLDLRPSDKFVFDLLNLEGKRNSDIEKEIPFIVEFMEDLLKEQRETAIPHFANKQEKAISSEQAKLIHDLFNHKKSFVHLNHLDIDTLEHVENGLSDFSNEVVRDKHSGLLSKAYYKLYLADKLAESKATYQAVYFSATGIRPSNTAYGHSYTDHRIEKTSQKLIEAISKKTQFNNQAFSFDSHDVFFIDQSGGNYLALLPSGKELSQNEINEIVEEVNSEATLNQIGSSFKIASAHLNNVNKSTIAYYTNEKKGISRFLDLVHTSFDTYYKNNRILFNQSFVKDNPNEKPFVKLARHLKGICNDHKDILKREALSGIDNQLSFKKVMENVMNFYCHCPAIKNPYSKEKKQILFNNLILALNAKQSLFNQTAIERQKEMQAKQNKSISQIKNKVLNTISHSANMESEK